MSKEQLYFLQSLDNALSVVDIICDHGALTLTEIKRLTGFSNATILRMLSTLEQHKCIQKDENGKYHLGYKFAYWGNHVEQHNILISTASPYLLDLRDQFFETVHLNTLLSDGSVLFAYRVPGKGSIVMNTVVGSQLEAYCTGTGKMLLACLDDENLHRIAGSYHYHRYTDTTITDKKALIDEINLIRARGYAIDNEESEVGLYCIAVPIKPDDGPALAAISISGPTVRMVASQERIITSLKEASACIIKDLGLN